MNPAEPVARLSLAIGAGRAVASTAPDAAVPPKQLEFLAFNGDGRGVYELFRTIDASHRARYQNRYVYFQAVLGCIDRCRAIEATIRSDAEPLLAAPRQEVRVLLDEFLDYCRARRTAPIEMFQAIETWCEYLLGAGLFPRSGLGAIARWRKAPTASRRCACI